MKRIFAPLVLLLGCGSAYAIPISVHFQTAGAPSSYVDASGFSLCWGCELEFELSSALDGYTFDLQQGEEKTFDFFTVRARGILGGMIGSVTANLAFVLPTNAGATGVAAGAALFAFGEGAGGLTFNAFWGSQPANIYFDDGGIFSVRFSDAFDICSSHDNSYSTYGYSSSSYGHHSETKSCELSDVVRATVKLVKAPKTSVPEPATLTLLGAGLIGMSLLRRRQKRAA